MRGRTRQQGIVALIVVIALFAIAALAALAMDASHVVTNKARLQSVVDAAALSAAKTLDLASNSTTAATAAGNAIVRANRDAYAELDASSTSFTFEYSRTYAPFTPGTTPARFVRVRASNFQTNTIMLRVAGTNRMAQSASAISGPQPLGGTGGGADVCAIVPIALCGTPGAAATNFGIPVGAVRAVTLAGGQNNSSPIGPGNFMFLRLGAAGGDGLRENIAGAYSACATIGSTIATDPGVSSGPARQGLNSRFTTSQTGSLDTAEYPPDVVGDALETSLSVVDGAVRSGSTTVTTAEQIAGANHAAYRARVAAQSYQNQPRPNGIGAFNRREVAVPIVNCAGASNSGTSNVTVLGFGCLYLLQKYPTGNDNIFAEVIANCGAHGEPGTTPSPVLAPAASTVERIVLFRVAGSPDS